MTCIFDMPETLGRTVLLGRNLLGQTAFRHDKDRGLALASPSAFQRAIFLFFGRFRGKEALVNLHVYMERVASVALAHHVAQLMHHLPYGLVTLAANLVLYLLGGYGTLGRRQEEHGREPVTDRQMGWLPCITVPERSCISCLQSIHVQDLRLGFQLRRKPPHWLQNRP